MPRRITILSFLLAAAVMAGRFCLSDENKAIKGKQDKPKLWRVSLYGSGLATGSVTCDLQYATIYGIGQYRDSLKDADHGWCKFGDQLPPSEVNALRRLVENSDLRDFEPKSDWFPDAKELVKKNVRYYVEIADFSYTLLISWEDREVAFEVPPGCLRSGLPKDAKRRYQVIDRISTRISQLETELAKGRAVKPIRDNKRSPDVQKLHKELERLWKTSLPKDRKGW